MVFIIGEIVIPDRSHHGRDENKKPNQKNEHSPQNRSQPLQQKTLRSLSKKGIFLVQSTWVPDIDGNYSNGMTAYVLSNGKMKTYLEVLALA